SEDALLDIIAFIAHQSSPPELLVVAVEAEHHARFTENVANVDIEYRFREEMLHGLVDFSTYRDDIQYRYEAAEIAEGYSLKLPDVYVACAATIPEAAETKQIHNIEDYVSDWALEKGLRHLAILGEYGQGKSVLALKIAHRLLFENASSDRVPILITLAGRSP